MHLATTLAALIAVGTSIGASASPIEFEARQLFPGNGSISLYSEQGCHASDVLVEDVAIVSGCNALKTPAASVRFNGGSQLGLPWTSKFQLLYPNLLCMGKLRLELTHLFCENSPDLR